MSKSSHASDPGVPTNLSIPTTSIMPDEEGSFIYSVTSNHDEDGYDSDYLPSASYLLPSSYKVIPVREEGAEESVEVVQASSAAAVTTTGKAAASNAGHWPPPLSSTNATSATVTSSPSAAAPVSGNGPVGTAWLDFAAPFQQQKKAKSSRSGYRSSSSTSSTGSRHIRGTTKHRSSSHLEP